MQSRERVLAATVAVGLLASSLLAAVPATHASDATSTPDIRYNVRLLTPGPQKPGDQVSFRVSATNNTLEERTAQWSNNLSGLLDDARYNSDAVATSSVSGEAKGRVWYQGDTLNWKSGQLLPGETVATTYTMTVRYNRRNANNRMPNSIEGVGPGSNCRQPTSHTSGDPCYTYTRVAWVNFDKRVVSHKHTYRVGDRVRYAITTQQMGRGPVEAIWSDFLKRQLLFADYNNDARSHRAGGAARGVLDWANPTLTWSGQLGNDQAVVVTYSMTVRSKPETGRLFNRVIGFGPKTNCGTYSKAAECHQTVRVGS